MFAVIVSNRKKLLLSVALFCLPSATFGMEEEEKKKQTQTLTPTDRSFLKRSTKSKSLNNGDKALQQHDAREREKQKHLDLNSPRSSNSREPEKTSPSAASTSRSNAEGSPTERENSNTMTNVSLSDLPHDLMMTSLSSSALPVQGDKTEKSTSRKKREEAEIPQKKTDERRPKNQQYLSGDNIFISHDSILPEKEPSWLDEQTSFSIPFRKAFDGMKNCCTQAVDTDALDPKRSQFYIETTGAEIQTRNSNGNGKFSDIDAQELLDKFWNISGLSKKLKEKKFSNICKDSKMNRDVLELIGSSAIFLINHEDMGTLGKKSQEYIDVLFSIIEGCYSFLAKESSEESLYHYTLAKYLHEYAARKEFWLKIYDPEAKEPEGKRIDSEGNYINAEAWKSYDAFWEKTDIELNKYYKKASVYLLKCCDQLSKRIEGPYIGLTYVNEVKWITNLVKIYMGSVINKISDDSERGNAYIDAVSFISEFVDIDARYYKDCFDIFADKFDENKQSFPKILEEESDKEKADKYITGLLKDIQKNFDLIFDNREEKYIEQKKNTLNSELFAIFLNDGRRETYNKVKNVFTNIEKKLCADISQNIREKTRKDFGEFLCESLEEIKRQLKFDLESLYHEKDFASLLAAQIKDTAAEYSLQKIKDDFENKLKRLPLNPNDLNTIIYHLRGNLESIKRALQKNLPQRETDVIDYYLPGALAKVEKNWVMNLAQNIADEYRTSKLLDFAVQLFDGLLSMYSSKKDTNLIETIISSLNKIIYSQNSLDILHYMAKEGRGRLFSDVLFPKRKKGLEGDLLDHRNERDNIEETTENGKIIQNEDNENLIKITNIFLKKLIDEYELIIAKPHHISNAGAHYELGRIYEAGYPISYSKKPLDYINIKEHYQSAAKKRHPGANLALGKMYKEGLGVQQNSDDEDIDKTNIEKAIKYFKQVVDGEEIKNTDKIKQEAQFELADIYENQKKYEDAAKLYELLGQAKNVVALVRLGGLYEDKLVGENDHMALAMQKYLEAAKLWDPEAAYRYGSLVENEAGGKVKWLTLAADMGHPGACIRLACKYQRGDGVVEDLDKAEHYYTKATEDPQIKNLFALAVFYLNQACTYENSGQEEEAKKWYNKYEEFIFSNVKSLPTETLQQDFKRILGSLFLKFGLRTENKNKHQDCNQYFVDFDFPLSNNLKIVLYENADKLDVHEAMYELGVFLEQQNAPAAFWCYLDAASKGHVESILKCGRIYVDSQTDQENDDVIKVDITLESELGQRIAASLTLLAEGAIEGVDKNAIDEAKFYLTCMGLELPNRSLDLLQQDETVSEDSY